MERRSFLKMFSGAIAAIPLLKFMPRFQPMPPMGKASHANIGRIDAMNRKHWFRVESQNVEFYDVAGQTVFPRVQFAQFVSGAQPSLFDRVSFSGRMISKDENNV